MSGEARAYRARRWIRRLAAPLVLLGIAAVAGLLHGWTAWAESRTPAGQTGPLVIPWFEADASDHYTAWRDYLGRVEARRRSEVGFELAGKLDQLLVDEGDAVEVGQVIARLDTERLAARRAELEASRAEAEARLELARLTFARLRELEDSGAASEQAIDDARQNFEAQRAAVDRVARAIDRVQVDLGKSTLRAPFDAIVATRHHDEGGVVPAGAAVFTLLERRSPQVRIGVPRRVADRLDPGQAVQLTIAGEPSPAVVHRVLPTRSGRTRTVDVIFQLEGELDGRREGELATYPHRRRLDERGYWLPVDALTAGPRGLWACFVAEPLEPDETTADAAATHRLSRRIVELLHQEGERVFVRGALSEGAIVMAGGRHRLTPGLAVRLAEAPAESPAAEHRASSAPAEPAP